MSSSYPLGSQRQADRAPKAALNAEARFQIRSAHLRDVSGLAAVLTDSFYPPHHWLFWLYPLLRLGIYEDLRARLRQPPTFYDCVTAIAIATDKVLGTTEIAVRPVHDGQCVLEYPYISNLAVHPKYRRQGIATQLLLSCEPRVLDWGYRDIYLHVLENNQQAQQLYTDLGYQVVSVEFNYAAWFLQQPRRILLHKRLSVPHRA